MHLIHWAIMGDGCLAIDSGKQDVLFNIVWNLQDGYGTPGFTPSQGFDWSGIRDSSPETKTAMEAEVKRLLKLWEIEEPKFAT